MVQFPSKDLIGVSFESLVKVLSHLFWKTWRDGNFDRISPGRGCLSLMLVEEGSFRIM